MSNHPLTPIHPSTAPPLDLNSVIPVRVGKYARISLDESGDAFGVDRQLFIGDARVAQYGGWEVVEEYVDNNLRASGKPLRRPAYERMLSDIREGRIDAIVAYDLDRLTRRPYEMEELLRECEAAGLRYLATESDFIDIKTSDGVLILRIKCAVAAQEAARIKQRTRDKMEEIARKGLPHAGGARAYGYARNKVDIVPEEAARIVEAAARVLAGETVSSICTRWNTQGVPTAGKWHPPMNVNLWRPVNLRTILLSARIAGFREHRGQITRTAIWEPIIDEGTQAELRAILDPPTCRPRRNVARHLLVGLLFCGKCGHRLGSGTNNKSRAYRCSKVVGDRNGCDGLSIKAEPVEEWLIEQLLYRGDVVNLASVLRAQQSAEVAPEALDEVAALEARLLELDDMFTEGQLDRARHGRAVAQVNEKLSAALRLVERQRSHSEVDAFLADGRTLRTWWDDDHTTTAEKRALLMRVFGPITVGEGRRGFKAFDASRLNFEYLV